MPNNLRMALGQPLTLGQPLALGHPVTAIDATPYQLHELMEYVLSIPIFQQMVEPGADQAADHKTKYPHRHHVFGTVYDALHAG